MRSVVFTLISTLFNDIQPAQNSESICPTVDVGYATYLGNRTYSNTVAYLGIPYAEPPVGDLRFRATVPLNTTRVSEEANLNGDAVINATYYPDFCIQGTTGGICGCFPKLSSLTLWPSWGCRRSRVRGLSKRQHLLTLRCPRRRQPYVLL